MQANRHIFYSLNEFGREGGNKTTTTKPNNTRSFIKAERQAKLWSLAYLRLGDKTGLECAWEVPGGHNDKSELQRETQADSDQTQERARLHNALFNQYRNALCTLL